MNQVISFVPPILANICSLDNLNPLQFGAYITDICQKDMSSRVLIEKRFNFSFSDKLFIKNLSSISITDFRNELALGYLSFCYSNKFDSKEGQKDFEEILSVEEEFKKVVSSNNNFLFLILFYLRYSDIVARASGINQYLGNYNLNEIKNILSLSKNSERRIDWLIVLIQSFIDIFKSEAKNKINQYSGRFYGLLASLSPDEKRIMIIHHLKYGQAINDINYFLYNKV